ncbi:MAG: methyltransferase, TIGR04325 family [Gammaproteobacteria bacterium]|jgi:putative methyltransferase (TIGR04325 family)
MKKFLKSRIKLAIEMLPMGRDLYLQLVRKRLGISYRGGFPTYQDALAAAERDKREYDIVNRNKAEHQQEEESIIDHYLRHYDYPLLFWLSRLLHPDARVLELGGSVGHFYYTSKSYFPHPGDLDWTIAELPQAVELGEKIARKREESQLRFVDSSKLDQTIGADVFVSAGTLQYMDTSLGKILESLGSLPEHVLLNSVPAHEEREGWTLQYLEVCEIPYRVFSRRSFNAEMESLGYVLVDHWEHPRDIEIPFHAELDVDEYSGFYWRHKNAEQAGIPSPIVRLENHRRDRRESDRTDRPSRRFRRSASDR